MTVRLGINGFGRIGRNILRALVESGRTDVQVVAINDLAPIKMSAHLFKNDSVHGRYTGGVSHSDEQAEQWLDIGSGIAPIQYTSERNPVDLPWKNVDIALECTGLFASREKAAAHLRNGSKKVLISAPASGVDKTIVYGVNHQQLSASDTIVSNASCTTNCLAPVADVLNRHFGIEKGYMTTIHAFTGDQPTLDTAHSDPYRARAASLSMIPTSTGAARAVGDVLPELAGKLDGSAIRVPTPNVSVIDLSFIAKRNVTIEEINSALGRECEGALHGIMAFSDEPLVSVDFNHDAHSSTVAGAETKVQDGNFVRVLSWYDNEWGFSNRMLDTSAFMASTGIDSTPQKSNNAMQTEPA